MKFVFVTGATRGLGLSIAKILKAEGYHVIGSGRKLTKELEAEIGSTGPGKISFEALDLTKPEQIHAFTNQIKKKYGVIFGLVNNAAIGVDGVLSTTHESQIRQALDVNLLSAIFLTKYFSRQMLLKGEGRIINVSSIIASTGFNGLSVYAATKAALNGFTKSLSRELGKANITVNTVQPGYMKTDMTLALEGEKLESIIRRSPMRKLVDVDDVANGVSFLLSDKAKLITGTTLTIDAGSTA